MSKDSEYYGVYLAEGMGCAVALFVNADQAQQWRKREYGDVGLVLPAPGFDPNPAVAELLGGAPEGAEESSESTEEPPAEVPKPRRGRSASSE